MRWPYLPSCSASGGGTWSRGVHGPGGWCAWSGGVCMGWGCMVLGGGIPACTEADPPVNRMTNRCKNITLPQTSFAGGNKMSLKSCSQPKNMHSSAYISHSAQLLLIEKYICFKKETSLQKLATHKKLTMVQHHCQLASNIATLKPVIRPHGYKNHWLIQKVCRNVPVSPSTLLGLNSTNLSLLHFMIQQKWLAAEICTRMSTENKVDHVYSKSPEPEAKTCKNFK